MQSKSISMKEKNQVKGKTRTFLIHKIDISLNRLPGIIQIQSMPVTVEELQNDDRFSLIEELSIDEIVQFIFQQIRLLNPSTFLFSILSSAR